MPLGFCFWDPRGERAEHVIKVDAALEMALIGPTSSVPLPSTTLWFAANFNCFSSSASEVTLARQVGASLVRSLQDD
jgi:hypothetical protein